MCNYWNKRGGDALCSECDPAIGLWHGLFAKHSADGLLLGNDGFLYNPKELESGALDWRIKHQGFKIIKRIGGDYEDD